MSSRNPFVPVWKWGLYGCANLGTLESKVGGMISMRYAARRQVLAGVIAVGLSLLSWGATAASEPDIRPFLSQLQSMGHGYHSDAEWNEVFRQLNALTAEAESAEAWTTDRKSVV